MSHYSIPPLISSFLFFLLGLFCYLKNKKSKINISFALMCLTIVWWQGSWTILFNIKDPNTASILVRFGYSGIIFLPVTLYHFIIEFLNRKEERKLVLSSYIIGMGFLLSLWVTNLFIKGYYIYYWGYYPKASFILHPVYLTILSAQVLRILYLLFIYLKKPQLEPIKRNQIKYIFWGIFFYTFAAADFADNYGLEFYPLGFIPVLIFSTILGHTIVKYKLLDIHFIIRKTITNLVLIFLTSCIICITYYPRINLVTMSLGIIISCLSVIYIPILKQKTEKKVTHILYKGKYDYLVRLEDFVKKRTVKPKDTEEELIRDLAMVLIRDMYVEKVSVLVRDHITGDYLVRHRINLDLPEEFKLSHNSSICNWLKKNNIAFVLEEEEKRLHLNEAEDIKKELEPICAKVCIPASIDSDLMGIIVLSNKTTMEMYTHIDLELLESLGDWLASALDNKRKEAQLRKEQELVSIGIMSMEISHELRNLLQLPQTFIDLSIHRRDDDEFFKDFRNSATERMNVTRAKLNDIMYLGKERPMNYTPDVDINGLLDSNLFANDLSIKKFNVEVVKEYSQILKIKADAGQLVHLWNNLILNAIDAMKEKDGERKLRIKTTSNNDNITQEMKDKSKQWVRIEIKDDGTGIPKHVLDKLFTPFVTTKSLGHIEQKGTGLGLSVVKKVVDAHKGYIHAHTKEGKGTTFVVDLPVDLNPSYISPPPPPMKGEPWEYKE